jgi:hypothetical protein
VLGHFRFQVVSDQVGLGIGSSSVGVISGFGSYQIGSGKISDYSVSDYFGFR